MSSPLPSVFEWLETELLKAILIFWYCIFNPAIKRVQHALWTLSNWNRQIFPLQLLYSTFRIFSGIPPLLLSQCVQFETLGRFLLPPRINLFLVPYWTVLICSYAQSITWQFNLNLKEHSYPRKFFFFTLNCWTVSCWTVLLKVHTKIKRCQTGTLYTLFGEDHRTILILHFSAESDRDSGISVSVSNV